MKRPPLLIGAHMSIAGGLHRAFERGRSIGCRAIQIFTKNARGWKAAPLDDEEVSLFRRELREEMSEVTAAHASYLINLGAPGGPIAEKSLAGLIDELERCEKLGIPWLVLHPGAHMGDGEPAGIQRIARRLDLAHRACPGFRVRVLLENAAGQGSSLGHRFEHLRAILDRVGEPHRVAVCFDTAHAFAGGYDLRTAAGWEETTDAFERQVGLGRIRMIHVNDSKRELGSRVDRHEHIGAGHIGLEGFRCLMTDSRLAGVPKVLETPKGEDMAEDVENLATLTRLAGRPAARRPRIRRPLSRASRAK